MRPAYFTALAVSSLLTIGAVTTVSPVQPAQATPTAAATVAAQTGSFEGVAHPTLGTATIIEENGKRYLEFDGEFQSDGGPDLVVLLHTEAVPQTYNSQTYVNLGALQATTGTQRYEIPETVSIETFQSAVIWCRQFNVTFGYATF